MEEEAKERQRLNALSNQPQNVEKIPHLEDVDLARSRDQAAELFQTNGRYVSDAKRIQQQAPQIFEQVKRGELNMQQTKAEIHIVSGVKAGYNSHLYFILIGGYYEHTYS